MAKGIPVRILFVIDQFTSPYAGTECQLLQLISSLPTDQFQPEMLVLRSSNYVDEGKIPCKTHVLGSSKLFSISTWVAMFRFARCRKKEGTALCHVFFNDSSIICPPIFSLLGIPTIISRRDMGYWYTNKYLAVLRQTARWVSHVVVNSEAVKSITMAKEGYSDSLVSVIYNGYPQSEYDTSEGVNSKNLRTSLGFTDSDSLLILVANLRPIKRIGDAIEALGFLLERQTGVHLLVVGGGDGQEYRELSECLGISENVHFLGARNDVKRILPAMDVGILCSQSEGYSNAIVEYMQAGLPVIASAVGGNVEAVEHGNTGYLYPVGEIQTLADYLMELLIVDTAKAAEMGSRGRELAMQRHGLNNMIDAHCSLYEELRSKGQPNGAGPQ